MNSTWFCLFFLILGAILFIIGNEQLLTYTNYNPLQTHMTRSQFQREKTESPEARFWWIIQLAGLTLGIISLLEIAVRTENIDNVKK